MNEENDLSIPQGETNRRTLIPSVRNEKKSDETLDPAVENEMATDESYVNEMAQALNNASVRGVTINPLSSGYLVKVGCQSVAVESTEKLIDMLNKYLSDPIEFERKWYSKSVRNRLDNLV